MACQSSQAPLGEKIDSHIGFANFKFCFSLFVYCVFMLTHVLWWKSEDSFQELVPSIDHVDPGD